MEAKVGRSMIQCDHADGLEKIFEEVAHTGFELRLPFSWEHNKSRDGFWNGSAHVAGVLKGEVVLTHVTVSVRHRYGREVRQPLLFLAF